jgi:tetratricopeptide (TPR) repeat protein
MQMAQDSAPAGDVARAARAVQTDQLDVAEALCRAMVANQPTAEAHHLLGMIAARAGDLMQAEREFRAALALDPRSSDDHNNLGNILQQRARPEEALACYEAALSLRPRFPEAQFQRARMLEALQRAPEAEQAYREVLAVLPDHVPSLCQLGRGLLAQRRFAEALEPLDRALALKPDIAETWCNKGVGLQELDRVEEALACHDRALALRPGMLDAQYHRARLLDRMGRWAEAVDCYRQMLALEPKLKPALCEIGKLMLLQAQYGEALEVLEEALEAYPELAEAWCNKGAALHGLGLMEAAVGCYDTALELRPNYADAFYNRGNALSELGRLDEALESLDRALEARPDFASALSNKGTVLLTLERPEEALVCFERALELEPGRVGGLHMNQGIALSSLGRPQDALACYDRALAVEPDRSSGLHMNRAIALSDLGLPEAALAANRLALEADPDNAGARHNEAMFRLFVGDFAIGWKENRWRWKGQKRTEPEFLLGRPMWDGVAPLAGRRVLLTSEQGLGDTIQFCRYAELVAGAGATVLVGVQTGLQRLLRSLKHADLVVETDERLPPFDLHCPMFDLPGHFGTTLATIPARVPYLRAARHAVAHWGRRLGRPGVPRVGFCWAGNPQHNHDRRRSMPLATLLPLLREYDATQCHFVCLQKQPGEAERALLAPLASVSVVSDEIADFTDTAGIVENLDLVITVDTSVAHLAGALARPVWIMITSSPDWRWMRERSDSPWYPTARLFRQSQRGDWAGVVTRVAEALAVRLASPSAAAAD